MRPLLEVAATEAEFDQVVAHDATGGLRLELVLNRKYWMTHSPTEDKLREAIQELKKLYPAQSLPKDIQYKEIDGFKLSPIEALFYQALRDLHLLFTAQCALVSEGQIKYRVDFMVFYEGRAVAVELDGHAAHKSREARTGDAARDHYLRARGIPTIRFTGSEVFKDVSACIREMVDSLTQQQGQRIFPL